MSRFAAAAPAPRGPTPVFAYQGARVTPKRREASFRTELSRQITAAKALNLIVFAPQGRELIAAGARAQVAAAIRDSTIRVWATP